MKKLSLIWVAIIAIATFSSCQRATYVSSVPAPTFEHKSTAPATDVAKSNVGVQEAVAETPVLYANADNLSVPLIAPAKKSNVVTNAAIAKMTATTPAKMVANKVGFKQKVVQKMVAKRVEKLQQKGLAPKAEKTNIIALISAVAAILGIILLFVPSIGALGLVLGLAALVMGFVGKGQIKRNGDRGMGWALVGIIGGALIMLLLLIGVIWAAALFGSL